MSKQLKRRTSRNAYLTDKYGGYSVYKLGPGEWVIGPSGYTKEDPPPRDSIFEPAFATRALAVEALKQGEQNVDSFLEDNVDNYFTEGVENFQTRLKVHGGVDPKDAITKLPNKYLIQTSKGYPSISKQIQGY